MHAARWGFLLVVAALGSAHAQPVLDTIHERTFPVEPGSEVGVPVTIPFHMERDGAFYAKVLTAPWSPINDGEPNGTVHPSRAVGLTGWWVEFVLADEAWRPLTVDGRGDPVNPYLGFYADATSTPAVHLAANTSYVLVATVHVPASGALPDATYRIPFALAVRGDDAGGSGESGATRDESRGFTAELRFGPGPAPSSTDREPGGGGVRGLLWALVVLVALSLAANAVMLAVILRHRHGPHAHHGPRSPPEM